MRNSLEKVAGIIFVLLVILAINLPAAINPPATAAGVTIRDDWGRTITLPRSPQRIVSLAPSVTEVLFAVGAGERVVGVTAWCNYPPAAAALPKVGDERISEERVLALRPDLVVADGNLEPAVVQRLEKLGLTVLVVAPRNLEGVWHAIQVVAKAVGKEKNGEKLVADLRRRVAAVEERVRERRRPAVRVLVLLDPPGLYTAGPGTFLDELIRRAGGENVAGGAPVPWPVLSEEEVILRDPEVIVLLYGDPAVVLQKKSWQGITAVRRGHVWRVDADVFSRPGPRLVEALETMADLLRGEEKGSR